MMRKIIYWVLVIIGLAALGCQSTHGNARGVQAAGEEAERAFLYSGNGEQRLVELARHSRDEQEGPRLYVYRGDSEHLEELTADELEEVGLNAGDGLVGISVEGNGATVNLWDWINHDISRLTLRLDSLSAHHVTLPGFEGEQYSVVFAAQEPGLIPSSPDRDFEIFRAIIAILSLTSSSLRIIAGTTPSPRSVAMARGSSLYHASLVRATSRLWTRTAIFFVS